MELLRALGVLCEPHDAAHARVAATLGLPVARPDESTSLFVFDLPPYASIYLGAEGMLGGAARERVAGFWRAVGLVPPSEPDHLAALLGLAAALAEAGRDAMRDVLLTEHVLPWTGVYLYKLAAIAPPAYAAWGRLLGDALDAGTTDGPLSAHVSEAPALEPPERSGGRAFLEALLAPVRSGMILTRADLARAARELGLGLRIGERRFVLRALLGQDARAALDWLAGEADHWAARPGELEIDEFWRQRAQAAGALLRGAATAARLEEEVHAR